MVKEEANWFHLLDIWEFYFHGKKIPKLRSLCFSKCMVSVKLEYSASGTWFIFTVNEYLLSESGPSSV